MTKIHDPIIQRMRRLPCQQSDTVLWWTRQSLQQWHTKTNDVQKHPTLCSKIRQLHQRPAQWKWPKFKTEVSLQRGKECVDAEAWDEKFFTSPHELCIGWSMECLQCVSWKHRQGKLCKNKSTPPQTSQLNNKYPGMCCLHPSIFWRQGWINKQYITPGSCAYLVTGYQDWWSYGCPPTKGYTKIIE